VGRHPQRNTITEIDTNRRRIVGRPLHVPGNPSQVSATEHDIVVGASQRHGIELRAIDRRLRRQSRPTFLARGIPSDLVADFYVFVLNASPTRILSLDDQLRAKKVFPLDLPDADDVISGPIAGEMAIESGRAWIVVDYHGSVELVRADLEENKLIGKPIALGRGNAFDLALDENWVWVPNIEARTVTRVDKQSGRVVGSPLRVGEISGQIAAADGTVWVAGVHDLIRIQP
jgi:hypothetical protein